MTYKIIKFGVVGGVGFAVDVTAMAFFSLFMPIILARAAAFWIAASSTWWCNRRFTFKGADRREPLRQWLRFLLSACVGFVPNWGCYWLLIELVDSGWIMQLAGETGILLWPLVAMIPGILLGMVANFSLAARWVFRPVVG